jgi:hypothetical protein
MEILHHHDERMLLTVMPHEVSEEGKGPGLPVLGAVPRQQCLMHRDVEQLEQQGRPVLWDELGVLQIPPDFRRDDLLSICLSDVTSLAEQGTHGQIGRRAAIGKAMSFPVAHRLASQTVVEFCE